MPRLMAVVGGGAYRANGPPATKLGTTLGALGGVGLDLGRARRGLQLEAQYHYIPNAFGALTGMLMSSIAYRF